MGKKTYRKHREWLSELDLCIVSEDFLNVNGVSVSQGDTLPSDHASTSLDTWVSSVDFDNKVTE